MNITTIGLDIAKNVFHCICTNKENRQVKKKILKRAQVFNADRLSLLNDLSKGS